MPDPIGVLVIAWMVLGVACLLAIEFGPPPGARRPRGTRHTVPAAGPPGRYRGTHRPRPATQAAAPPPAATTEPGCPQPAPPSTPTADHGGGRRPDRPRVRP